MSEYVVARFDSLSQRRGRVVDAGGRALAVFRVGDRVYALDNTCLHSGGPLGEGDVEEGCVVCPWHLWRYDLETGASPLNSALRVETFEAWVDERGDVRVRMPAAGAVGS